MAAEGDLSSPGLFYDKWVDSSDIALDGFFATPALAASTTAAIQVSLSPTDSLRKFPGTPCESVSGTCTSSPCAKDVGGGEISM